MAELLDDVSYLSQEIGPRPAGTEEEQQAALYIADKVHERTGFHAEIEDIRCMAYSELVDCIYFGAATVLLALAFFLPVTSIVTFILAAIVAVLFFIERVQKRPILGRVLTRDISQNVVVKYKPGTTAAQAARPRKIVVVANYDSGRVRRDATPRLVGLTSFLSRMAAISLIVSPLLILLRNIVLAGSLGVINALFTLLCVVALVFMIIQLVILLVHRLATFNEAANNNASSIAVMLEVLRRIDGTAAPENAPRPRDVATDSKTVVHGAEEAKAAGVVPAGAALAYDDELVQDEEPAAADQAEEPQPVQDVYEEDSAAARLRSAKAAIAALTGEAVDDAIFLDLDEKREAAAASATEAASFLDRLTPIDEGESEQVIAEAPAPVELPVQPEALEPEEEAVDEAPAQIETPTNSSVPAWYLSAQAKANRPVDMPVRRSRYADDVEVAVREREQREQRANALVDEETEERLRQMRESFAAPVELEKPAEELVVEPVQDELAAPEPQEVQPEAVEEDLEVTASFPPVGDKGETVEFVPEFEIEEEAEPEPELEPEPAPVEDEVLDLDDYDDVIEVPLELIEEDDEYDDYYDEDDQAGAYDAYEEEYEEPAEEAPGILGRFGRGRAKKPEAEGEKVGLFARLRNAVMPEDQPYDEQEEDEWEPEVRRQPVAEELEQEPEPMEEEPAPLEQEAAPVEWEEPQPEEAEEAEEAYEEPATEEAPEQEPVEEPEAYEDEDYYYDDEEPSRFESLRDRVSGAFSRLTSRIAPPPDYNEADYSYEEENAYEPLADYEQPVAAQEPVEYEQPVEAPVYAEEQPMDEPVDEYVQPAAAPQAYEEAQETVADVYPQEEAYEDEQPYAPVDEEGGYEEDELYDEWEQEESDHPGFFERVSGFWNRLVGRRDDEEYDEEFEDGFEEDYGYEEEQELEEDASAPAVAPAEELVYQSAYAPRRVAPKSYDSAPVEEELGFEPEAEPYAPVYEPETVAPVTDSVMVEVEPVDAYGNFGEPEPLAIDDEYETAEEYKPAFVPMTDPDMAYQQVTGQPGNDEHEIPLSIPAARPTANPSTSANPRVGLRQRVAAAMSSWEEPAMPEATAPFNPISPDMTAPFDPAPADLYDDDLSVEPVDAPELDAQASIFELPLDESTLGGTIAMPPIDVNELRSPAGEMVDEPLFEEVVDADMLEPTLDSRVQLPEIPFQSQQNAPLAQGTLQDDREAAKSRLSTTIPSIDVPAPVYQDEPEYAMGEDSPSHTERMRRLRADLPSMSGRISGMQGIDGSGIVSQTGSFAAVSATGNIDPVGDELIEELDPEDIYVDDVDDSLYGDVGVAEAGAYIAADYVKMPEKRRGLFGRRKRREADVETTPQQWLGVADDFDAREVGRARGDWTSFQENDERGAVGDRYEEGQQTMWRADRNAPDGATSDYDTGLDGAFKDEEDDFLDDDYGMNNGRWNGGAFSGRRAGERTTDRDRYDAYDDYYDYGGYGPSGGDEYAEFAEYADENYDENAFLSELEYEDSMADEKIGGRFKNLTARFSRKDTDRFADDDRQSSRSGRERRTTPGEDDAWNVAAARAAERSAVANVIDDPRVQEELGETYGFVDDAIVNEVWFVALGAGGSDNAGMEAFLDAHGDELRGAMVINLEGIGDGDLVGMASEGLLKSYKPTTRMKRFLRNAGQATGIRVGQAQMNWRDSAATVSMRRGIPTITVAGVDGDVPVRYASSDDVADKLDEGTLKQRVNFILELLRTI